MQTTQVNELINSPVDLLVAAAVIGVIGGILFGLANLIMKATGDDINKHARESERYRHLGTLEQMSVFYSNLRNMPVAIGIGGLLLLFAAVCMAIGALGWFIVRAFSGG